MIPSGRPSSSTTARARVFGSLWNRSNTSAPGVDGATGAIKSTKSPISGIKVPTCSATALATDV